MAMTGASDNFESLLHQLNAQSLRPVRLIIGIESFDDPAYQRVLDLASIALFPIQIKIAGATRSTAQKCWNQLAAASLIDSSDKSYVVLLDVDINPPKWWLAALIKPLFNGTADVVGGYRWQQSGGRGVWSHVITFLDRANAVLPKVKSAAMLWGGSIAMRRDVFNSLLLSKVLESTITDDLAIATHAKGMGYRLLMRRMLLVPSRAPDGLLRGFRFGVRQYQIVKIHRPVVWALALMSAVVTMLGWSSLLWMCFSQQLFIWALVLVYVGATVKMIFTFKIAEYLGFEEARARWQFQFGLIVFKPFIDLFNCVMIISSAWSKTVVWGHVTYRVDAENRIKVLKRQKY